MGWWKGEEGERALPLRPRTLGAVGFPTHGMGTPPQGMALLRAEGRWSTPKSVAPGAGTRAGPLRPFSATGQEPLLALLDGGCCFLRHSGGGGVVHRHNGGWWGWGWVGGTEFRDLFPKKSRNLFPVIQKRRVRPSWVCGPGFSVALCLCVLRCESGCANAQMCMLVHLACMFAL